MGDRKYPTRIDLCDGKYSVIYDLETAQSECLRYGEKWRDLCGDNMVLAMFDRIVELEGIRLQTMKEIYSLFERAEVEDAMAELDRLINALEVPK